MLDVSLIDCSGAETTISTSTNQLSTSFCLTLSLPLTNDPTLL